MILVFTFALLSSTVVNARTYVSAESLTGSENQTQGPDEAVKIEALDTGSDTLDGTKLEKRIDVGAGQEALALNPDTNMIYAKVYDYNNPRPLLVVDGSTNKLTNTIPLDGTTYGDFFEGSLAVNPTTNIIYDQYNWTSIYAISGKTNAVVKNIRNSEVVGLNFGDGPIVVNPKTNIVYAQAGYGSIAVIDGLANNIANVLIFFRNESDGGVRNEVNSSLHRPIAGALNPSTHSLYMPSDILGESVCLGFNGRCHLLVFDTEKNAIIAEIPLEGYHSDINDVAVNSNTSMVYVARTTATDERPEGITVINGTTNKVVFDIPNVRSDRVFVDPAKNIIYSLRWGGGIDIIDGEDYSLISRISLPLENTTLCRGYYDAAFNPKTSTMYMSHRDCNYISAFDLSEYQRKPIVPIGEEVIHRPLLGINNLPPPGLVPGRTVFHSLSIKNYGTTEGQFVFLVAFPSIVEADFKNAASTGQMEILYSENNLIVYSTSLKPFGSKFLTIPIKLRPEAVQFNQDHELEQGKFVHIGDAFISAYIIELATLSIEDWAALKDTFNGDALIERAIQMSLQSEEDFFTEVAPPLKEICNDEFDNDFDHIADEKDCIQSAELKKVYDERFNQLMRTYDVAPALADYVAWSVISSSLESLAVEAIDRTDESQGISTATNSASFDNTATSTINGITTTPSSLQRIRFNDDNSSDIKIINTASDSTGSKKITYMVASPGKGIPLCDNPVDCQIFQSLKDGLQQAIQESKLDVFACVFGEESKGLFSNTVNSFSFGLVDMQFEGDHNLMATGKTVGKAVSWAGFAVRAAPALGSVAKTGWAGAKNIVANWKYRLPIVPGPGYPVLAGREVISASGAAGNILKIAGAPANPKFDSSLDRYLVRTIGGGSKWYVGFGHNPGATSNVGGKIINPGWGHIYFWPFGKIAFLGAGGKAIESRTYPIPALAARLAGVRLSLNGADPFGDYCSKVISAWDPNHLYASKEGYISGQETRPIQFTATFENLANATASAFDVKVVASLDNSFDLNTFQALAVSQPDKLQNVTLDNAKREATWYFKDINLPPNKNPPEGEGWVKYSIAPLANLNTDTILESQAKVFFDFNPPIETNTIELKIDNDLPSTRIKPLQSETTDSEFDLEVMGSDVGSGISNMMILTSTDDGQNYKILNMTTSTGGTAVAHFKGEPNQRYSFVSIATDNAGNTEIKQEPDTNTTIKTAASGGKCLIATAAFGSEIAPQVQLLRDFRDNYLISTAAGSSFMNVFNAWYYSFSPYVADYEREQPWLQNIMKIAIYPLLGILTLAQSAYSGMPGEYGALSAGLVASSMIGALYFWPFALSIKQVRSTRLNYKLCIFILSITIFVVAISIEASNSMALMVSTSILVLTTLSISAVFSARAITRAIRRFSR